MTDTTTAGNVDAYGTGDVLVAPVGTSLPTSADEAVNVAFEGHGYLSQDGIVETQNEQSQDVFAWQNNDLVRRLQTSHDLTYQFTMIEVKETTLRTYYGVGDGSNVSAGGATVQIRGGQGIRRPWVLNFLDGDKRHVRVVVPDGQITDRGPVTRSGQGVASFQVTITCYPDNSGVKAYSYLGAGTAESS